MFNVLHVSAAKIVVRLYIAIRDGDWYVSSEALKTILIITYGRNLTCNYVHRLMYGINFWQWKI